MIPPLSTTIFSSNPQFASLHESLTQLLNHDASTKTTNRSHRPVEDEVNKDLTRIAKENLLAQSLQDPVFSYGEYALPEELRELVYIISTYVTTTPTLSPSQIDFLGYDVGRFREALPKVAPLISHSLESQYTHLHALLKAFTPAGSTRTAKLPHYSLQGGLQATLSHLRTLHQSTIPSATTTLINTLTTLLSLYTQHLSLQLTHLTRYTYGTLSRHTLSHSSHLSTVSQALSSKIQLLALEARRSTYSAPTQTALANYSAHLHALNEQLDNRIRTLQNEVRLYEDCDGQGGKTIAELGRRYGDVLREIEEVKGDVERLEREEKGTTKTELRRIDCDFP